MEASLGLCAGCCIAAVLWRVAQAARGLLRRWQMKTQRTPRPRRPPPRQSSGEVLCRAVLEDLFKKPFPSTRPYFLMNPIASHDAQLGALLAAKKTQTPYAACTEGARARCLELDGFNAELRIAFEFQGRQHTDHVPFFHRSVEAYECQRYRDVLKRALCAEYKVLLIEIDYKTRDIRAEIVLRLQAHGLAVG